MEDSSSSSGGDRRPWVVKPGDVAWAEAPRTPDETTPPARELEGFRSPDGRFTFGLWERDVQDRPFDRPYDEVMCLLEGVVELELDDGSVIRAEAGDILVTPKGSRGHWRSLGRTRKVWAIYEHPTEAA